MAALRDGAPLADGPRSRYAAGLRFKVVMRFSISIALPLMLVSGATASETDVRPMIQTSPPPALAVQLPEAPTEIDVIDDAMWERFAGLNGPQWWLQPKVVRDRFGHTQLDNAKFIVERFRQKGLPDALALAVIVNALMESSLLSDRVHPVSKAAGLFQCWKNPRQAHNMPGGGAGNGTPGFDWGSGDGLDATMEQMLDRERNLDRIVFELLHVRNTSRKEFFGVVPGESFGADILRRAHDGATVAELAALWGERSERYRPNPGGSYDFRGKIAYQLFGDLAFEDTRHWRKNTIPEPTPCAAPTPDTGTALEHRLTDPLVNAWSLEHPWWHADLGIVLSPTLGEPITPCS
jgi:hypothetical protein